MKELRITNSEIANLRQCRRKWWLAHYRKLGLRLEHQKLTGNVSIGNRVHDALAQWYAPEGTERRRPIDVARESYDKDVAEHPTAEPELRKEQALVEAMLEGYMMWLEETGNDEDFLVIASESKIEIPFVQGPGEEPSWRATLLSKIDSRLQRRSDGTRLALETKTVSGLTVHLPLLQIDPQVLTEHLTEFLAQIAVGNQGERADGVIHNYLRKVKRTAAAKPPFYGREEIRHNIHELRSHWKHVAEYTRQIAELHRRLDSGEEHHHVVPPSPSRDCTWKCPFFKICPMFDDGSDVEAAIADLYEEIDPLDRYSGVEEAEA